MNLKFGVLNGACVLAAVLGANPANAQDAAAPATDAAQEPELVVTGSRLRDEAIQETPIAVTVANEKTIADLHASDMRGLSMLAPNLTIRQTSSNQGTPVIFLRGFGAYGPDISTEPGIAIYVDSIYRPTSSNALSDLFDVERIEVLRGPQSTLLGKNASAGAILVTRTRPSTNEFKGRASVEYGSFNLIQGQGLVNVPLVNDVLGLKLYGSYRHRDGWQDVVNATGAKIGAHQSGEETYSLRAGVLFTPTSDINIYLSADRIATNNQPIANRLIPSASAYTCTEFGICPGTVNLKHNQTMNGFRGDVRMRDQNYVANADWTIGGAAKLTSITGYHRQNVSNDNDIDASPFPILEAVQQTFHLREFSQEIRLQSAPGGLDMDGRLNWLIGGYYNHADGFMAQPLRSYSRAAGVPVGQGTSGLTNQSLRVLRIGKAAFAHVDFNITEKFGVSGGIRFSKDELRRDFSLRGGSGNVVANLPYVTPWSDLPYSQKRVDKNTSIELGAQYKIDQDRMVYFRYAEGYRGGGYIGLPASLAAADYPAPAGTQGGFGPETSTSYELGLKSEFFDRRLTFNLTVFSATYDGLQRTQTEPNPLNPLLFINATRNIAKARMRGIEVEVVARPIDGLNIRGSFGYVNPKYLDYTVLVAGVPVDRRSEPFAYSSKTTFNITPSYEFDLASAPLGFDKAEVQFKVDYRSRCFCSNNSSPLIVLDGYAVVDGQFRLASSGGYSLTGYVSNLFDNHYYINGAIIGGQPTTRWQVEQPGRTIGAVLEYRF